MRTGGSHSRSPVIYCFSFTLLPHCTVWKVYFSEPAFVVCGKIAQNSTVQVDDVRTQSEEQLLKLQQQQLSKINFTKITNIIFCNALKVEFAYFLDIHQ